MSQGIFIPSYISIGLVGQVSIIHGIDSFESFIDTDTEIMRSEIETKIFCLHLLVITDNISIV